mgnify:CR=1 FL=1|tara:strand:+ start:653 stop:1336 length:684 start_codon:yes stop_codon:yes gene_type:complete
MNTTVQTPLELNRQDLFPSSIYRGNSEDFLHLDKACDPIIQGLIKENQNKLKSGKIKQLPNSYHSENLWNHKPFEEFVKYVMQQMWNILAWQGYELKGKKPLLQECWVQEFPEEGGFHEIHIHPNNHMSGFYFLQCNEETSKPSFHDPRPGKTMTDLRMRDGKKIEIGSNQVHYSVKPGDFIFFNSFMPHAYSHHKGKNKFRFIHFNMAAVTDPSLTKISEDENNGI